VVSAIVLVFVIVAFAESSGPQIDPSLSRNKMTGYQREMEDESPGDLFCERPLKELRLFYGWSPTRFLTKEF